MGKTRLKKAIEKTRGMDINRLDINSAKERIKTHTRLVFNSMEEGVWETNLLIHTTIDEDEGWCPITIGAECVDEIEELVINGKNMGINLPKQVIKAVYQSSYRA